VVGRRGLLAGAAALALSGCGRSATEDEPGGSPQDRTATSRQGDVELLQAALGLEQQERNPHDRAHAEKLRQALRDLDAERAPTAPPEPPTSDRAGAAAVAIAFYLDILPKLYDADVRKLVASILVVESEQLAHLRERDGQPPAPDAFVYGSQA
jgi:rubrerythrin